jgi:hypothetical protein
MMITDYEYQAILRACRAVPRTRSNYLENDFVMNLFSTVLDYQMHRTSLAKAESHYRENRWREIRTRDDLASFLGRYPDTQEGNTAAALYIWGNRHWTRLGQLRGLLSHFDSVGVTDQDGLRRWARTSSFERDFKGRVKGLSFAIYKWLVMRQGVPTIKPDVHVKNFLRGATGRQFSDEDAVSALEQAAAELAIPANELDWSIWDHQRSKIQAAQLDGCREGAWTKSSKR